MTVEALKQQGNGATSWEAPPWPEPLGEDALYGLAGDVVRTIAPHSEADPVALLLQFLAAVGNACGRSHYVLVEADRHPPQVWPLLVGETSKGRKGTSWGRVVQVLEPAAPDWARDRIKDGASSGEGLLWEVRDPITKRVKDDDSGEYADAVDDPGVDDKRLPILETEFASVLRHFERPGNTLSGTLRQFWDRGVVSALTKNSPARTTGAMLGIVGHITCEELRRYLTRTEMANGLANRFVFACVRRSKALPFGGKRVDLSALSSRVSQRLERVQSRGDMQVDWTRSARRIWADVYPELSEGKPGMFGAVTSRAEAQALRLALTYALLDGVTDLKPAHVNAALAVWRYCEQSVAHLFGSTLGDPVADDILRALKGEPGGLTRNELMNLFGRNRASATIGGALDLLLRRGVVRSEKSATAGRPEERWFCQ